MTIKLTNRFILVLDVETANALDDALTYDVGGVIMDIYGNIYEVFSFVVRDIFCDEREIMRSAYYAGKIPEYSADIREGRRMMVSFMYVWRYINKLMKAYDCHVVAAYNANFDRNALNVTLRYLTKSKFRYFFPRNTEFICIWNMACNSICQTSEYKTFAETNYFVSNHGKNYRATAETVYAFITGDSTFKEEHKGLDDVMIECKILLKCVENGCAAMGINRGCWQRVKRAALTIRA